MDSGSGFFNDVGGAGRGRACRAGDDGNRFNAGVRLTSACGDAVGSGV